MRVRCAAEGVSSDRNEATLNVLDIGKRRRHQNGLIDRTAHRRNEACLVHSRSKDGKVPPLQVSDVAIEVARVSAKTRSWVVWTPLRPKQAVFSA